MLWICVTYSTAVKLLKLWPKYKTLHKSSLEGVPEFLKGKWPHFLSETVPQWPQNQCFKNAYFVAYFKTLAWKSKDFEIISFNLVFKIFA